MVSTKITVYHEKELRAKASTDPKMKFLNVGTRGLNGRPHPVLNRAATTSEAKALKPVVKMLNSDYYTFSLKNSQSGGGSHCRLCPTETLAPTEDITHVLTQCAGTQEIRIAKLPELMSLAESAKSVVNVERIFSVPAILCQFLLDCCSNNLDNDVRIAECDPTAIDIYITARHIINAIHCERLRKIKAQTKK